MKIATVIGARPQFIKASAVSRALAAIPSVAEILIHTGQHYDSNMSAVFFDELEIPKPHYNLGVGSGLHGEQTGRQLAAIEQVLIKEKPDWVLVYGDTNSTLAGALAAAKLHLPIAHVEAGLRSFKKAMPEEINRILTDHCSDQLFAPSGAAVRNLEREGICFPKVHEVGDVMYDVALHYGEKAARQSTILTELCLQPCRFILATIHRAANTDDPQRLQVIIQALQACSQTMPVVLPLHPRTRSVLEKSGVVLDLGNQGLKSIPPVGYLDMVTLEKHAAVIATDSGGVQKEAFFYGVPCVTLRDETEWTELVELGWNRLVPTLDSQAITQAILAARGTTGTSAFPYGNGHAAEKIAARLATFVPTH